MIIFMLKIAIYIDIIGGKIYVNTFINVSSKPQKENFIGKDALVRQQKEGVKRRFVQLLLKDHDYETDPWPWGGEPIYLDDRVVGRVTTTAFGFTLNTHVSIPRLT